MNVTAALAELARYRTNEVVVTTMGGTREWSRLSSSGLDFHYLPSAMGQAPMIALGLALAQPAREVIVLNGDGSLLMSLGGLVTIAASGVKNLTMILLDNGIYEVTGGQPTAAAHSDVRFSALARAVGIRSTAEFADLESWKQALPDVIKTNGPRFISLRVEPVQQDYVPKISQPITERILSFRKSLTQA
jgi:sulfopyruvate decarboxylase subunit beta